MRATPRPSPSQQLRRETLQQGTVSASPACRCSTGSLLRVRAARAVGHAAPTRQAQRWRPSFAAEHTTLFSVRAPTRDRRPSSAWLARQQHQSTLLWCAALPVGLQQSLGLGGPRTTLCTRARLVASGLAAGHAAGVAGLARHMKQQ